jgi:hypothetical protein
MLCKNNTKCCASCGTVASQDVCDSIASKWCCAQSDPAVIGSGAHAEVARTLLLCYVNPLLELNIPASSLL